LKENASLQKIVLDQDMVGDGGAKAFAEV